MIGNLNLGHPYRRVLQSFLVLALLLVPAAPAAAQSPGLNSALARLQRVLDDFDSKSERIVGAMADSADGRLQQRESTRTSAEASKAEARLASTAARARSQIDRLRSQFERRISSEPNGTARTAMLNLAADRAAQQIAAMLESRREELRAAAQGGAQ